MSVLEDRAVKAIDLAIGYFMVEQKLTREQMAELLGISTNTLRWKREGKTDWSWSEILRLSDITGKSPDELAGLKTQASA